MKKLPLIFLLFLSISCFAKDTIKCTDNVLKQIYPNQNACVLQDSIPHKLLKLSCVTSPIQISNYNIERFNFNKRFNVFPKAIISPKSSSALSKIFRYLKKHNLDFSIRSGGHCFEPGSLSSDFILDLHRLDSIKIGEGEVYIGAGARLGPVIEKLGQQNLALPTGTCQSVGMGGLTLGGGIGFLSRTYGLTCDALKSITFLTASGAVIEVNQKQYPDLFWALRGAGNGSYGIALGYTFKAYHVPTVTFLKLKWNWNTSQVYQIFDAWQAWIQQLPDTINPVLTLEYAKGNLSILLEALKVGPEPFNEWKAAFQSLNPEVEIETGSYAKLAQLWADSPTTPFQKIKSLIAFQPISFAAIQLTVSYFEQLRASHAPFQVGFEFSAFGGKLAQGDTAFYPRQAFEWWHQAVNWNNQEDEEVSLASIRQFYTSVQPLVSNFCYANDVDYDLGSQYLEAYYGDHVSRLMQIKKTYDPQNIFHWKQSIPLP
jgi:hypothetical protein